MIIKLYINNNNKLIYNNFYIDRIDNKIIINNISSSFDKIQNENEYNHFPKKKLIPLYNNFNCITYYPIYFPLELLIINDLIFNPYIILSSYNNDIDNEIDFFYQLKKIILNLYNLSFYDFKYFLNKKINNFFNIINNHYDLDSIESIINNDFNNKENILNNIENQIYFSNEFIFNNKLWELFNIIKLSIIIIIIKNKSKDLSLGIYKKNNNFLQSLVTNLISFKFNLSFDDNCYLTTLDYYYNNNNNNLLLKELNMNNYYYIINNTNNNIFKINIIKINNNVITISNNINLLYNNYKWYYYYPSININKDFVIFQTFINNDFTMEILKYMFNNYLKLNNNILYKSNLDLNIYIFKYNLIIKNYNFIKNESFEEKNNGIVNYISSNELNLDIEFFIDIKKFIISYFDKNIFEFIVKKYNNDYFYKILNFLFNIYNYPFKINRHDIDIIFDYILYISLYNNDLIFINNVLNPEINNIIPSKLKNLYINILKTLIQIINNNFDLINFNQKFYNDYLHKNIILIIFTNSNNLFINYFKNKISIDIFNKFKYIVYLNFILLNISTKLNWNNLSYKLNYLNLFYKNNNLIFYQNKINKNILHDKIDNKIKKIIENSFEMYKYLKKESDFIKWTNFINDKIIDIYYIPIPLINEDYKLIGKLIYLLHNLNEQNINDKFYSNFLNFCNNNNNIILNNNRINIKIKEIFPNLKCNINLGILAKHLTWNKDIISLEDNNSIDDFKKLENKLEIVNNKYNKYKKKYIKYRNNNLFNNIII